MRDRKGPKYTTQVLQSFALISQFGITMLVSIFLCTFLGIWLDRKLGTSFLAIVLFFVGALSGALGVYKLARGVYHSGQQDHSQDEEKRTDQ